MTIALNSLTDYILEVDLEYPQNLHDAHTDFCPRDKLFGIYKRENKLLATLSYIIEICSNVLIIFG